MAERIPKTLADLSKVMGTTEMTAEYLGKFFSAASETRLDKIVKRINDLYKTEQERAEVYKVIAKKLGEHLDYNTKIGKLVQETLDKEEKITKQKEQQAAQEEKIKKQYENYAKVLENVANVTLSKILEQNQHITKRLKQQEELIKKLDSPLLMLVRWLKHKMRCLLVVVSVVLILGI